MGSFGKRKKIKPGKYGLPKGADVIKMCVTFLLVAFGLIFFKASSMGNATCYINHLFSFSIFDVTTAYYDLFALGLRLYMILFVLLLVITEWTCRKRQHNLEITSDSVLSRNIFLRWTLYIILLVITFLCKGVEAQFIYFQF